MQIKIIGTESLGVRGMCCAVTTSDRYILIDPGISLGLRRFGLLPHPIQVAACDMIREEIKLAVTKATDIVISHFHGDHHPMVGANPYQLQAIDVANVIKRPKIWAAGSNDLSLSQKRRAQSLALALGRNLPASEGMCNGSIAFSKALPHGEAGSRQGWVMMTRVSEQDEIFVHASDIQLLDHAAVQAIIDWHPTCVLVSGPPIYLKLITRQQRETAWQLALELAGAVKKLIIDHHLLRSEEGLKWLRELSQKSGRSVVCAAENMGRTPLLLEARRKELYKKYPPPPGWHDAYAHGEIDTIAYRKYLPKQKN